jgi:hypothetical protein
MQYFKHPHCNHAFTAPPGTEDECGTLHVKAWVDPTFGPASTSYWRPSVEELAALNGGGSVALTVFATGHPVVMMDAMYREK